MRIQLISDTHNTPLKEAIAPKEKTLILAGDINTNVPGLMEDLEWAAANWENVIYVPGNHCFYRLGNYSIKAAKESLNIYLEGLGVHVAVDPSVITIEGQRFVCCTMWSNVTDSVIVEYVSDYRYFTVPDLTEEHHKHVEFLKENIRESDVVVTHHVPLREQLQNKNFPLDLMSTAFNTEVLLDGMPKAWIFGHNHYNYDKVVRNTRYISNQYGYKNEGINEGVECLYI